MHALAHRPYQQHQGRAVRCKSSPQQVVSAGFSLPSLSRFCSVYGPSTVLKKLHELSTTKALTSEFLTNWLGLHPNNLQVTFYHHKKVTKDIVALNSISFFKLKPLFRSTN